MAAFVDRDDQAFAVVIVLSELLEAEEEEIRGKERKRGKCEVVWTVTGLFLCILSVSATSSASPAVGTNESDHDNQTSTDSHKVRSIRVIHIAFEEIKEPLIFTIVVLLAGLSKIDGVTVVLYKVMQAFNLMDTISAEQVVLGIVKFFVVCLGGLLLGIIAGLVTAVLTRHTVHVGVVQPLVIYTMAYLGFLMSELFEVSGIISIIGCGLVQRHYAFSNISDKSRITVKYFTKVLASASEIIIFLFLGLSLVNDQHEWHTGFVLWTLVLCLVYRFLSKASQNAWGITIKPLVNLLSITLAPEKNRSMYCELNSHERLEKLDSDYLKKWFMNDPDPADVDLQSFYQKIVVKQLRVKMRLSCPRCHSARKKKKKKHHHQHHGHHGHLGHYLHFAQLLHTNYDRNLTGEDDLGVEIRKKSAHNRQLQRIMSRIRPPMERSASWTEKDTQICRERSTKSADSSRGPGKRSATVDLGSTNRMGTYRGDKSKKSRNKLQRQDDLKPDENKDGEQDDAV
nr:hypothetical protein BaRGS_009524 [Batillaria attramentaria]